jgi:hypothetical protein
MVVGGFFTAACSAGGHERAAGASASGPASLLFFARPSDVPVLLDRLNADPEIAFIVPDGPLTPEQVIKDWALRSLPPGARSISFVCINSDYRQRWKAARPVQSLNEGEHSLWHIPAGPLPLLRADGSRPDPPIPDPWSGWTEGRPGCMPHTPYFGPAWPAEIRLQLITHKSGYDLVVSSLAWPGGPQQTQLWFDKMQSWFGRTAARLPAARFQDPAGTQVFWAFPAALESLKAGATYYADGFDLDAAIRRAVIPPALPRQ